MGSQMSVGESFFMYVRKQFVVLLDSAEEVDSETQKVRRKLWKSLSCLLLWVLKGSPGLRRPRLEFLHHGGLVKHLRNT